MTTPEGQPFVFSEDPEIQAQEAARITLQALRAAGASQSETAEVSWMCNQIPHEKE